jgi:hypothetical protein
MNTRHNYIFYSLLIVLISFSEAVMADDEKQESLPDTLTTIVCPGVSGK